MGILSSISLILELYLVFLTASFFTTLLNLIKSVETDTNLSTSIFSYLSISNFSTLDFNLAKPYFLASCNISTLAVFFKSDFVE